MSPLLITAVAAAIIYAITVFFTRFYAARKVIRNLQKANAPMPPFHPIFGHLLTLKSIVDTLPENVYPHVIFRELSKSFPNGIFYIDLWPYSKPLMIVSSLSGAAQVEALDLHKPPEVFDTVDKLTGGPSLLTMHGSMWKKWRRSFSYGFSEKHVQSFAPEIAKQVAVFCELLRKHAVLGEVFQLEELTLRLTLDVIAITTLNAQLNYQTMPNPLASAFLTQIAWTNYGTSYNPIKRFLTIRPLVEWYCSRTVDREISRQIDREIAERIQERKQPTPKKRNQSILTGIVDEYLSTSTTKTSTPTFKKTITPQLRLFMFAGHDTTSSTLVFCMHMLSSHPAALTRTRTEQSTVFGPDVSKVQTLISNDPSILNRLPYTTAIIKETLRLYTPAGALRRGRIGADISDEETATRYQTAGCDIWVLSALLHRNPSVWKEPEKFLPERWLVGPEDALYPKRGAWRAFELGARNCIGQTLAVMNLRIAISMTVRLFDVMPAYEDWDRMDPRNGIRCVDGERVYHAERGGGGGHPDSGYPCRVVAL